MKNKQINEKEVSTGKSIFNQFKGKNNQKIFALPPFEITIDLIFERRQ